MPRFLHVANGSSVTRTLAEAGVPGLLSIWADPLHDGPVPGGLSDDALLEVRRRFHEGPPGSPSDDPVNDLRKWRRIIEDIDAYYALVDRNRVHLNQHGDYQFEHDADVNAIRSYFETPWDTNVRLGIWSGNQVIGRVDLNPIDPPKWVLGYWVDEASTGRGIVAAACRAAIGHATTLGATEIYAGVTNGNTIRQREVDKITNQLRA